MNGKMTRWLVTKRGQVICESFDESFWEVKSGRAQVFRHKCEEEQNCKQWNHELDDQTKKTALYRELRLTWTRRIRRKPRHINLSNRISEWNQSPYCCDVISQLAQAYRKWYGTLPYQIQIYHSLCCGRHRTNWLTRATPLPTLRWRINSMKCLNSQSAK